VLSDRLAGIAVHIGARVAAVAAPREVLVSRTVRDLVVGSGIEFDDRGSPELKDLPGEQQLFAVRSDESLRAAAEPVWSDPVGAGR
jgi:class 3 adenylate cyclase